MANDEAGLIDFFAIGIFKPTYPLIGKGTSKLKGFGSKKMLAGLELKKEITLWNPWWKRNLGKIPNTDLHHSFSLLVLAYFLYKTRLKIKEFTDILSQWNTSISKIGYR